MDSPLPALTAAELIEHIESESPSGNYCYTDGEDWPCRLVRQQRTIDAQNTELAALIRERDEAVARGEWAFELAQTMIPPEALQVAEDELAALRGEIEQWRGQVADLHQENNRCAEINLGLRGKLEQARAAMREIVEECDRTMNWRKGGMRPATDISMFANTALSAVIKIRRHFGAALSATEEQG